MAPPPPFLDAAGLEIVDTLRTAVHANDLCTVERMLDDWAQASDSTASWPFNMVLDTAIEERKPQVVSCVLNYGLTIGVASVHLALDAESSDVFQAFVDSGWDINAPLGRAYPPPLA